MNKEILKIKEKKKTDKDVFFPTRDRFEKQDIKGIKVITVRCSCGKRVCINDIIKEVIQKTKKDTAKAILEEVEEKMRYYDTPRSFHIFEEEWEKLKKQFGVK